MDRPAAALLARQLLAQAGSGGLARACNFIQWFPPTRGNLPAQCVVRHLLIEMAFAAEESWAG
jgi:hypothetical protein